MRKDITDKLVHFTKGDTFQEAFGRLKAIAGERRLIGGSGFIKGGYSCVCFSEAPLTELEHGLLNGGAYSRYSPFGVVVDKSWLFEKGGRPVIYQPDAEYDVLPESHKWRHVRYEANVDDPVDFTWEREWRIQVDELILDPATTSIVVPDSDWANALIEAHEHEQDWKVLQYSQIMDEHLAYQYRESFEWRIYTLR